MTTLYPSDESLVLLTLSGDRSAYEALVTRWQKAVCAAAQSVLHSAFLSEDAAQDAFITAWLKLDSLREPAKYGMWVQRIARNAAKNTVAQYKSYLPEMAADTESADSTGVWKTDPAAAYLEAEETEAVRRSVGRLPARVALIIRLHYFEDVPVAEIARRLGITEGTVKRQLFNGRKQIRKELCAMNETMNDTLVSRVMKKVEELKNWQYKNTKHGFAEVYRETLSMVEELPETDANEAAKYHAMADVLARGWWWLPDAVNPKSEELRSRIREAAERGHNEEVMRFLAQEETRSMWGDARTTYIRDELIPRLERNGYTEALAAMYIVLGNCYYNDTSETGAEQAKDAFTHALAAAPTDSMYHALAAAMLDRDAFWNTHLRTLNKKAYQIRACALDLRKTEASETARCYKDHWYSRGDLYSCDMNGGNLFRIASTADGYFTLDGYAVGDVYTATDGTTLTYLSDAVTVEVPAGTFDGCHIWQVCRRSDGYELFRTYYKAGVGIVKQEHIYDSVTEVRLLSAYSVHGTGLLPLETGNTWEYVMPYDPAVIETYTRFTVEYAGADRAAVTGVYSMYRKQYDENSFTDMISQIRTEYFREVDGDYRVCDVSHAIARAKELAKTPLEIAHANAAGSVAQRIMDCDPTFNHDYSARGIWNFFNRSVATKMPDQTTHIGHHFRWSFELKHTNDDDKEVPVLCNDILDILGDTTGCIRSPKWVPGYRETLDIPYYSDCIVQAKLSCEKADAITTRAGTFDDCIALTVDVSGLQSGVSYRGGKKVYTFARGIGLVRMRIFYAHNTKTADYDLISYEGVGDAEDYMPITGGLVRTYEAQNLTDGYIGKTVYTFVDDGMGNTVIFADKTGIKARLQRITEYGAIDGETVEDVLWNKGEHDASRLRHAVNNFHLFAHFLGRPTRYWARPDMAVEWNKYRLAQMEMLGDGQVPDAWAGMYAQTAFRTACALFGLGRREEGYDYLERAFPLMEHWLSIPKGTDMEIGNPLIWGGIRVRHGEDVMVLPDRTLESLPPEFDDRRNENLFFYGMTAEHGWEWFNPVRGEDAYKEYVARARKLKLKK